MICRFTRARSPLTRIPLHAEQPRGTVLEERRLRIGRARMDGSPALGPNATVVLENLAMLNLTRRSYEEVVGYSLRALALDPNDSEAHIDLGAAYREMGNIQGAEVQMRRAVALAPLDVKARAVWGNSTSVSSGSRRAVPPVSRNTTRQQGISRSRNGPLAPRRREGSGALLHRSGLPGSSMAQPHIMLGLLYLDLG
jgi:tetratricopeptide (TPR) repeat protein